MSERKLRADCYSREWASLSCINMTPILFSFRSQTNHISVLAKICPMYTQQREKNSWPSNTIRVLPPFHGNCRRCIHPANMILLISNHRQPIRSQHNPITRTISMRNIPPSIIWNPGLEVVLVLGPLVPLGFQKGVVFGGGDEEAEGVVVVFGGVGAELVVVPGPDEGYWCTFCGLCAGSD